MTNLDNTAGTRAAEQKVDRAPRLPLTERWKAPTRPPTLIGTRWRRPRPLAR